jgi:hypothetical protein
MAAKVVKTLAVSGIGTFKLIEAPIINGTETPEIDNTTFDDAYKSAVPDPQPKQKALTLRVTTESGGTLAVPAAGTSATLAITGTYADGGTIDHSIVGFISDVTPQTIAVGGERVQSFEVVFTPSGGGTTTTTTTSTTTT